ncbi:MAG: methylaspartate ammonia-lyase [Clostridia bacterium]|nr:methylaspartate ammonia-lyase [Clostridia bacterium]MBQ4587477.1 methylaspartate ammonia-lyase [Clostridia bacterium]MBQ6883063.1 methylaspartate ammonia-lyase [Clostridia bacterium]
MKIKDVILTKSYTGFYFDDQKAIKQGAGHDGFMYLGEAVTEGFTAIRQAGEAISIQLILEDGSVALGDCAAVQYSGAGGRDPLFIAEEFIPFLEKHIVPELIGQDVSKFRPLAEKIDTMVVEGKRLHTAIRYGLSQAILNATATARRITMAEVIRDEYDVEGDVYDPIPVFTQSGDDRHDNADKMIIKQADVLPHALINNVETKLGKNGEILLEYIAWLRDRILKYRTREDYSPVFHMDVYGTIGLAFNYDVDKMFNYLLKCEETAKPFRIRIEGPIDTGDREGTLKYEKILTSMLNEAGSKLEIVADEWCNTLEDIKLFADEGAGHVLQIKTPDLGGVNNVAEAIIYCNKKGVGSYCGGTCNETDQSAKTTTNIAIACRAIQCLAKPGMGVDEGYMIVKNEMNRVVAAANRRAKK